MTYKPILLYDMFSVENSIKMAYVLTVCKSENITSVNVIELFKSYCRITTHGSVSQKSQQVALRVHLRKTLNTIFKYIYIRNLMTQKHYNYA